VRPVSAKLRNLHVDVALTGLLAPGFPADEVRGTLFMITETELAAADAYEVSAYKIVLKSGGSAWVYVKA
jgi:hypothetical protein